MPSVINFNTANPRGIFSCGRNLHGLHQFCLVRAEQTSPAVRPVVAQSSRIFLFQRVDKRPHRAGVLIDLRHGLFQISGAVPGEQPVRPGTFRDVFHVLIAFAEPVGVVIHGRRDEGRGCGDGGPFLVLLVLRQLLAGWGISEKLLNEALLLWRCGASACQQLHGVPHGDIPKVGSGAAASRLDVAGFFDETFHRSTPFG